MQNENAIFEFHALKFVSRAQRTTRTPQEQEGERAIITLWVITDLSWHQILFSMGSGEWDLPVFQSSLDLLLQPAAFNISTINLRTILPSKQRVVCIYKII